MGKQQPRDAAPTAAEVDDETGIRQPEAMALYESVGWRPIANYGAYSAAEWSRCYELSLVSPPG